MKKWKIKTMKDKPVEIMAKTDWKTKLIMKNKWKNKKK